MSGSSNPETNCDEELASIAKPDDMDACMVLVSRSLTVGGVVGDEVVLDEQDVGVDDGGATQLRPQAVAGGAQLGVKLVGAVVEGLETAAVVEVGVVGPRRGELLRQAAQRAGAVDPEVLGTVVVEGHDSILYL